MNGLVPRMASVSDLQRDYKSLLNLVEQTKEPVVLLKGNKAKAALVDIDELEKLLIIKNLYSYQRAEKAGKILSAKSVDELFKMVADEGKKSSLRKKVSKSTGKTLSRRAKKD